MEFFWNSWASSQNEVKLIVCGSATSWMINKLIKNKGGLYNRLTARIKLEPFTLNETELFLKSKCIEFDRYQIVQIYMAMEGIPYYLDQIRKGLSSSQNIQKLCFENNGILKSEFTFIFSSLFINGGKHEHLLRLIYELGGTADRESIIKKGTLTSGGNITGKLKELEESGFITSHVPFRRKISKKIYTITDFYTLFYLKFIETMSKVGG